MLNKQNPELVGDMLSQVLEEEDRPRYARILSFLDQQAQSVRTGEGEKKSSSRLHLQDWTNFDGAIERIGYL